MSDDSRLSELSAAFIEAAQLIGNNRVIKAHVKLNVKIPGEQYPVAEINLSESCDQAQDGTDRKAELLTNVINEAFIGAEMIRDQYKRWRMEQPQSDPYDPYGAPRSRPGYSAPDSQSTPPPFNDPAQIVDRTIPRDWGLLMSPPRAGEIHFGDQYEVLAVRCSIKADSVEFWGNGKYPVATIKKSAPQFKNVWAQLYPGGRLADNDLTGDGQITFGVPMALRISCSSISAKHTRDDNPWANVVGARALSAEQAAAARDVRSVVPEQIGEPDIF